MVRGSDKTYGQLILEAQSLMDTGQQVGETVEPIMKQLDGIIHQVMELQYQKCKQKNFKLPKYYIHIFIVKDPQAYHGMGAPNVLRIRQPQVRVTRPSPYQEEDHYLWSVTDYFYPKYEWSIPGKADREYILANPNKFDPQLVRNMIAYKDDKLEKLEDYLVEGKII